MRHGALLLALAVAATAPTLAQAKKLHHYRHAAPAPVATTASAGPNPFIVDGLHQFFVPFEVTLRALSTPQPAPAPVVVHRHRVHRAA